MGMNLKTLKMMGLGFFFLYLHNLIFIAKAKLMKIGWGITFRKIKLFCSNV